jgi:hypothetical protein
VQPTPATHSYTGRIPSVVFGNTILIDVATQSYAGQAPKLQARVQSAAVVHVYSSRVPEYVAQIAYTAEPLRARIGATPDVDTHTRIGSSPATDEHERIGPSVGTVTMRIGNPAK